MKPSLHVARGTRGSRTFRTALAYAAIVFGTGFVLGAIRVFLVVPRIGVRSAELLETPLMLLACFLAARFTTHRWGPFPRSHLIAIGLLALALMLLAEVGLVLAQGLGILEYVANRDPVSGTAYLVSLAVFAALPALVARPAPPPAVRAPWSGSHRHP